MGLIIKKFVKWLRLNEPTLWIYFWFYFYSLPILTFTGQCNSSPLPSLATTSRHERLIFWFKSEEPKEVDLEQQLMLRPRFILASFTIQKLKIRKLVLILNEFFLNFFIWVSSWPAKKYRSKTRSFKQKYCIRHILSFKFIYVRGYHKTSIRRYSKCLLTKVWWNFCFCSDILPPVRLLYLM